MKRSCWNCGSELDAGALTCHFCHAEQNLAANWGRSGQEALERPVDRPTKTGPKPL